MSESESTFDLVVIGSGPGGYVGAVRAAQLGLKTAIIEKDATLGGTCLNVGCIPSKALLESSEHYHMAKEELVDHGINTGSVKLDLKKMMERKSKIVGDLTGGVEYLMKKNKITQFKGLGVIKSANQVDVLDGDKILNSITAKNIMIATGSAPAALPFLPYDEKRIVSSTGALSLSKVPKELVIVGGGVIGLELGSVWMRLGAKVTVVEFTGNIAGPMDKSLTKKLLSILKKQGMNFILNAAVISADLSKKTSIALEYEDRKSGDKHHLNADVVLVSTGRRPYTEGLGLENVGITPNQRGQIEINAHYQTNVPNIYAIGDVVDGPMLAHKAEEEGVAAAEFIATGYGHVNYDTVPGVIYTWPEVASVGKTEEQLKESGIAYNAGQFPFSANGRAKSGGMTDGMVKILADKTTDRILGVHILGPRASELIGEAVVAMEFGGSSEDLARSFHAHPTLTEVIREAALAVDKRARQM